MKQLHENEGEQKAKRPQTSKLIIASKTAGGGGLKYLLFTLLFALSFSISAQNLVNPNATPAAKAIKKFMDDQYGKKIISGQCNASWIDYIKQNTGQKEPAMMAYDFNHSTPNDFNPNWNDDQQAIAFFKRGGIPAFQWHWRDPMGTKSWDKYDFDLPKALSDHNSNEYKNMIRDIDIVAGKIKNIQDAGAAIVFRPLHEAEGAWFWWGGYGKNPCQELYKLIFYRLTNDWKLNNIIWVWNSYGTDKGESWYPGDQFADIIAYDYASNNTWNMYQNLFGGKGKLFGLAEEGKLPDPNNFSNNPWSFFVCWDYMVQEPSQKDGKNDKAWLYKVYNDSRTITLSDMPGWSTGLIAVPGSAQTLVDNDGNGFETVTLDGSASTSSTGSITSYTWKEGTTTLGTTAKISVSLPTGEHAISLTVTDSKNPANTANVSVSIKKVNLALNKPVNVSSTEVGNNVKANAVDGNLTTRWSSLYTDPQWVYVDLQASYKISDVTLTWEAASAKDYSLDISTDAVNWTPMVYKAGMAAGAREDKISGLSGIGRYVRMNGTARTGTWGYSLFEFEIYGGPGDIKHVTSVSVTPKTASLEVAQTAQLVPVVLPVDATNPKIKYSTSAANVATVSPSGLITAIGIGTATITAASDDVPSIYATCTVTVKPTIVTGVTLTPSPVNLAINATQQLTATVSPANATVKTVKYVSSDPTVASVTLTTGLVTALKVGTTTITVTTDDQAKTATSTINVTDVPVNIALKKPVKTSCDENAVTMPPSNINDGNYATRWSSCYSDPVWVIIDLQGNFNINSAKIYWEAASAKDYKIEASNDGVTWTMLVQKTGMAAGARTDVLNNLSGTAKFIKLTCTARTSAWGNSIFEFEVYGNTNIPPVANAGPDQIVRDANNNGSEPVTLNGSLSNDPDGSIASYSWTEGSLVLSTDVNPALIFSVGVHEVTLTVTDNKGAIGTDKVNITVSPYNVKPIANAGPNQTVIDVDGNLSENVALDASASRDTDGKIVTYTWKEGNTIIAVDSLSKVTVNLSLGIHTITLIVTDNLGAISDPSNVTITVNEKNPVNLALGITPTVSSTEAGANVPANATDGNKATRWASIAGADPQWIMVDLKTQYSINRVVLNWENASAKDYKVEVSKDGSTWANPAFATKSGMAAGLRIDDLSGSGVGRYVRVTGTARNNVAWGYSLFEFEVYGVLTPVVMEANAGPDQKIQINNCTTVNLDGSQSAGAIVSYIWKENGTTIATGVKASVSLCKGIHTITLEVTDSKGLVLTDDVIVTIEDVPVGGNFYIKNGKLYDANNAEFIIRGVNTPNAYYDNYNRKWAYNALPTIASYNANTIRIVWYRTPTELDASWVWDVVQKCVELKMVAMIDIQEFTCTANESDLLSAAQWFANNADNIKKYERYLLLNIANEWGSGDWQWQQAYEKAVKIIRDKGIKATIVIDAPGCGQDLSAIKSKGQYVIDSDPLKNILFSVHMYGDWGYGKKYDIGSELDNFHNSYPNFALVVGEFGWKHGTIEIDWQKIMDKCQEKGFGYMPWSWCGNGDTPYLDMVVGDDNAGWTTNLTWWGESTLLGRNGIKQTGKPASIFSTQKSSFEQSEMVSVSSNKAESNVAIYPTLLSKGDVLNIRLSENSKKALLIIADGNGRLIVNQTINNSEALTINNKFSTGIYLIKVVEQNNVKNVKIIVR